MLKLLFFLPCEKPIFGQDDRLSIISVIEHLFMRGRIPENLPAKSVYPFKWSAVCLWTRTEDIEEAVEFEFKTDLLSPNGQVTMTAKIQFEVSNEFINYRNAFEFPVFPIGPKGIYNLVLSYKRIDSKDWIFASEYPIPVLHHPANKEDQAEPIKQVANVSNLVELPKQSPKAKPSKNKK